MSKIYIIAGEPSGDFIGSRIIKQLITINPNITLLGVGGSLMKKEGIDSLFPIEKIAIMGFFEILPHIFESIKLIKLTASDIVKNQPNILITIDSPGFTYQVAKHVRALMPNLKMIHVVAPSVWAYKPKRAAKYAKIYDHMLALLPFEPPYFTKLGLKCSYIGHPILEQNFYNEESLNTNDVIICVTAGSRRGEIIQHMPIFAEALEILAKKYVNLKVVFAIADPAHVALIESFTHQMNFHRTFTLDKLKAYANATVALAKSGTNTLEIAASGTPMVVAYKVNILSYLIIKALIKIKYVSLINIISDKQIIPEFLQFNCIARNLANTINNLILNPWHGAKQVEEAMQVLITLGMYQKPCPSAKAASIIMKYLPSKAEIPKIL